MDIEKPLQQGTIDNIGIVVHIWREKVEILSKEHFFKVRKVLEVLQINV